MGVEKGSEMRFRAGLVDVQDGKIDSQRVDDRIEDSPFKIEVSDPMEI